MKVYKFCAMPNQRSPDQKLLPFTAKGQFITELDGALRKLKITNRSQFIRDAIKEKLCRLGIEIPDELVAADDRFGKGGPKPKTSSAATAKAQKAVLALVHKKLKPGAPGQ
jgi:hypothetical protein